MVVLKRMATASTVKKAAPAKAAPKRRAEVADDGDGVGLVTSGWGKAQRLKEENSTFEKSLRLQDGQEFYLKFMEDAPFANLATHWIERDGRKSFLCAGGKKNKCPACMAGIDVRLSFAFNVIVLTDTDPYVTTIEVGSRVLEQIKGLSASSKTKPLPRWWYLYKRTGSKINNTTYTFSNKSVSQIEEEDPDISIPSEAKVAKMMAEVKSAADIEKRLAVDPKEFRKVIAEVTAGDDDDE